MKPMTPENPYKRKKKKPRDPSKPKRPFVYRFAFYPEDDVMRAQIKGPDALTDLRIRDTYLKILSGQKGIPLQIEKKDPLNPGARTRTGDWVKVIGNLDAQQDFAEIPTSELLERIKTLRADIRRDWFDKRSEVLAIARRNKAALVWHRPKLIQERYEVIDGRLHERRYRVSVDGVKEFETSPHPIRSTSVRLEGKRESVPFVINWLLTGYPARMKPGPKKRTTPRADKKPRYKAQIRIGSVVKHLGMFDSPEERDHAVRVARVNLLLGLSVYPSP
jgi:hypothetical protein